ncbi:hypothetical protein ABIB00_003502 [Bradyrhizobium sp. LB14.3]|uniref:hypothetical protein n=1 Tax=Bradyrhizobium sp. LB14.3 TaxID=3156328 RepID=UPI00339219CA
MMKAETIEPAIQACFCEIHTKLKEAEKIARAARACADAGSISEAIQVSMNIEQLVYEVGRLHDAACLLARNATIGEGG